MSVRQRSGTVSTDEGVWRRAASLLWAARCMEKALRMCGGYDLCHEGRSLNRSPLNDAGLGAFMQFNEDIIDDGWCAMELGNWRYCAA